MQPEDSDRMAGFASIRKKAETRVSFGEIGQGQYTCSSGRACTAGGGAGSGAKRGEIAR